MAEDIFIIMDACLKPGREYTLNKCFVLQNLFGGGIT